MLKEGMARRRLHRTANFLSFAGLSGAIAVLLYGTARFFAGAMIDNLIGPPWEVFLKIAYRPPSPDTLFRLFLAFCRPWACGFMLRQLTE